MEFQAIKERVSTLPIDTNRDVAALKAISYAGLVQEVQTGQNPKQARRHLLGLKALASLGLTESRVKEA